MMEVWSDIGSVPRNGQLVWLFADEGGTFVMRWNHDRELWQSEDELLIWTEAEGCGPTHWMPYSGDPSTLN